MTATIKKKLCWNCEGRVPAHEENCPYCGVYLNGTLQKGEEVVEEEEDVLPPAYVPEEEVKPVAVVESKEEITESIPEQNLMKKEFVPMLMLLLGTTFFIFGMVLLFFSHDGLLKLQWNASFWYIYLGLSIPALFIGWRSFVVLEE